MKNIILKPLIIIATVALSSCSVFTELEDKVVLRFESQYGRRIPDQLLVRGELATEPEQSAPGYLFHGWYRTPIATDLDIPWNFNIDRVENSMTLYAKWTAERYTISFQSDGFLEIAPISFYFGDPISLPTPTRSGYTFITWCEDANLTIPFTLDNLQPKDYTLYAKWLSYPTVDVIFQTTTLNNAFTNFANRIAGESETELLIRTLPCDNLCTNLDALENRLNSEDAPVLFQLPFNGENQRELMRRFSPYMLELTNQSWVNQTDVALWYQQKVYGFPLYMNASGLVYNKNLIENYNQLNLGPTINPETWFNYQNFANDLIALHANRQQIGVTSVIGFSADMPVAPFFNSYLSLGKSSQDYSVLRDLELGRHPPYRIDEYANWLKLFLDFSDQDNDSFFGNGTQQALTAFLSGQSVVMPYLPALDTELRNLLTPQHFAMVPLGQISESSWRLSVHGNQSWIFINRFAEEKVVAYLKSLMVAYTNDSIMRNQVRNLIGSMHPFRNSLLTTNLNQLNQSIIQFYLNERTSPFLFDQLENTAKIDALITLHERWFVGMINRNQFVSQLKSWVESYP